jgi:hypothetical protein
MKTVVCRIATYVVKKCRTLMPPPDNAQIKSACKDVAWEYAALLGAALEMTMGYGSPMNHIAQEAFLTHVRNLAAFFRDGVKDFKKTHVPPPRHNDDILAVDFCLSVGWKSEPFRNDKRLIRAINKTLSHMTYSRDRGSASHQHFEGHEHLHGTVKLMQQTMGDFLNSVRAELRQPQHQEDIRFWLTKHTENWRKNYSDLEREIETRVNELARQSQGKWKLRYTPDGPI